MTTPARPDGGHSYAFEGTVGRVLAVFMIVGGLVGAIDVLTYDKLNAVFGPLLADTVVRLSISTLSIISVALGIVLWRAAGRLARGDGAARKEARAAVLSFPILVLLCQALVLWKLYPMLQSAPPPEPFPGFWTLSIAVAPISPVLLSAWLAFRLRRRAIS